MFSDSLGAVVAALKIETTACMCARFGVGGEVQMGRSCTYI